jgi:glycine/D-amino acid oxidase-like deaminating enzyme
MDKDEKSCWVGATYERNFLDRSVDKQSAIDQIMPQATAILPDLANETILDIQVGIRASGPKHLPVAEQVSENVFVIGAMGSKGLLFHAHYAKKLSQLILG